MVNQLTGGKKKTHRQAFICSANLVDSVTCWYGSWERRHYNILFPVWIPAINQCISWKIKKKKWSDGVKKKVKKREFSQSISVWKKVFMDQRKFREWIHMPCFYLLSQDFKYGFTAFTIQQIFTLSYIIWIYIYYLYYIV